MTFTFSFTSHPLSHSLSVFTHAELSAHFFGPSFILLLLFFESNINFIAELQLLQGVTIDEGSHSAICVGHDGKDPISLSYELQH